MTYKNILVKILVNLKFTHRYGHALWAKFLNTRIGTRGLTVDDIGFVEFGIILFSIVLGLIYVVFFNANNHFNLVLHYSFGLHVKASLVMMLVLNVFWYLIYALYTFEHTHNKIINHACQIKLIKHLQH